MFWKLLRLWQCIDSDLLMVVWQNGMCWVMCYVMIVMVVRYVGKQSLLGVGENRVCRVGVIRFIEECFVFWIGILGMEGLC